MKTAIIHGALLLVMLIYGYSTWTRDKSVSPDVGSVQLWERSLDDLTGIAFKSETKEVKLEKRSDASGAYWWGTDTSISKRPKPTPAPATPPATPDPAKPADATKPADPAAPATPADATKPADPAAPAEPPKPAEPEMEEVRNSTEFPGGEATDTLAKLLASAKALRSLGTVSEADKKTYKLDEAKTSLTVSFRDGQRTFLIGGQVYGGADRYVLETSSGKGYVLSRELITPLEQGMTSLRLGDPRGYDVTTIEQVTIAANNKTREAARVTATVEGAQTKTWGDAATKKADQALANFVDNSFNMMPTSFDPALKMSDLTPVLVLTYKDAKGAPMSDLKLFKRSRAAELPADGTGDLANPPPPVVEYYILTPKTRVLAMVNRSNAERAEQDLATILQ